jgi:hypothetical protein
MTTPYSRQFSRLPAGFIATTAEFSINQFYLDTTAGTYTPYGLGVIVGSNFANSEIIKCRLPAASTDNTLFAGVIVQDHTIWRGMGLQQQPLFTYQSGDLIPVIRRGEVVVPTTTAVDPTQGVYLIFNANTNSGNIAEIPGQFRSTTSANCFVLPNAKWKETQTVPGAAVMELFNVAN